MGHISCFMQKVRKEGRWIRSGMIDLAEKVGLGMWDKGRLGGGFRACL